MAATIRSWLSFTAASASPTRKNLIPRAVFTSMVIVVDLIPMT